MTIINSPPVFIRDTPSSILLTFNQSYDYILPSYLDLENDPIIISIEATPTGIINKFAVIQQDVGIITFLPN